MIIEIIIVIFVVIALAACIVGGLPERATGVMFLIWIPVNRIEHQLFGRPMYHHVDAFSATADSLALIFFTWLALRSNRVWPIVCAGAQCVAVGGHLAALLLGARVAPYWAMTQVSGYVQIVALAAGTWAHRRRVRRIGPYRSWRRT